MAKLTRDYREDRCIANSPAGSATNVDGGLNVYDRCGMQSYLFVGQYKRPISDADLLTALAIELKGLEAACRKNTWIFV